MKSVVELVSYTVPADSQNVKNTGELIAYCARVSNPENQHNSETSEKLLKYLIKHKHWSPFEMANVCIGITTTRDIARQILRHRSFSFQEFSQRYSNPVNLGYVVREARLQDAKNRQNSIEIEDQDLQDKWSELQSKVWDTSFQAYKWAIDNGIAKEVARAVLPEGMAISRLYMNGSIRSWIHYIEVRSGEDTQKEHREIALECSKIIGGLINNLT
jgi:thymidylate synthase (FAD)